MLRFCAIFFCVVGPGIVFSTKDHALKEENHFEKIVHGVVAKPGQFPWHAGLFSTGKKYICGGALIDKLWILTAAHCLTNVKNLYAVLGTTKMNEKEETRVEIYASQLFTHEQYNSKTIIADIGLIKLKRAPRFNTYLKPIPLATEPIKVETIVQTCGWGIIADNGSKTDDLLFANLTVDSMVNCHYGGDMAGMICVGSNNFQNSCFGDSGGPLMAADAKNLLVHVGITSFGYKSCEKGYPVVYTDTYFYKNWILNTIRANS